MQQLSASKFKRVYEMICLDQNKRGCVMIDVEPIKVTDIIVQDDLYFDPEKDPDVGFGQGAVSEVEPHVTLLYGLAFSGPEMKAGIDGMLGAGEGIPAWKMPETITIEKVDFFYGNPDEPNIAIVAKVEVSPELLEGNQRLKQLLHIDTFPEYTPHITLAYVKDSADYEEYIRQLQERLGGTTVKTLGLNYGK